MGVYKIVIAVLFISLIGCRSEETVSKADYDMILNEYMSLKETTSESRELNINQAKTLSKTVEELAMISGRTADLRRNMEDGTARLTQADKISNSLAAIKSKISELEKQSAGNAEFIKTIKNLKSIITGQEVEISDLKGLIKEKEAIIKDKDNTINAKNSEIHDKNQALSSKETELSLSILNQIDIIYRAGTDFEDIASQIPDVSRKANKRAVDEYQKKILNKALLYYDAAASSGHTEAKARAKQLRISMKNE